MPEQKSKIKNQKSKVQVKSSKLVAKKGVPTKAVKPTVKVSKIVKPAAKPVKTESVNLTISIFGLDGKATGKVALPAEIFGEKVNKKLLAQAVRVYLANKRQGNASTKTRGEVDGSTRKIYKQKGTGNARHGSIRAPIFVKGGIVHGPKPKDYSLELPKKMRRKALFSALSAKLIDGEVKIISGFEKIEAKTKVFAQAIVKMELVGNKTSILLVTPDTFESAKRGAKNLQGINSTSAHRLNALDILRSKYIVIAKESLSEMESKYLKKD